MISSKVYLLAIEIALLSSFCVLEVYSGRIRPFGTPETTVQCGESINLVCDRMVKGNVLVEKLAWVRSFPGNRGSTEKEIINDDNKTIIIESNDNTEYRRILIINNLKESDNGEYACYTILKNHTRVGRRLFLNVVGCLNDLSISDNMR